MPPFDAQDLLHCYARGVFPMADAREDPGVFLVDPERRGVIPLNAFHVSRRLARTVRAEPFVVRLNTAFHDVVLACAASGPGRTQTWINRPIERLYLELHALGHAHSVECWQGGELVGGLYGVSLGGAFFGESMFSRRRDASKVALVHLVGHLISRGFRLLDTQFLTDHLASFGAREIDRADYRQRLAEALGGKADFYGVGGDGSGAVVTGSGAAVGAGEMAGAVTTDGAARVAAGAREAGGRTAVEATGMGGAFVLQLIAQAS
jgi:leucyl/phenylalanyl-tRNA--protein transferase